MYIDGTAESTQSGSTATTQSSDVMFGEFINGGSNYFNGYLDEIRISNVARYTANFTDFGQDGGTITSPTAFTEDDNTILLIHSDQTPANVTTDAVESKWTSGGGGGYTFSGNTVTWSQGDRFIYLNETFSGDFEVEFTTGDTTPPTGISYVCTGFNRVSDEPGVLTTSAPNTLRWYYTNSWWYRDNPEPHYGSTELRSSVNVAKGDRIKFTRVSGVFKVFYDSGSGFVLDWEWESSQSYTGEVRFGINPGGTGTGWQCQDITYTQSNAQAFADSSGLAAGFGTDASGNTNHFELTNITASDQVTDTPTNNFPVMNTLDNQPFATTFAEGNLEMTTGGSGQEPGNMATMGMSSGKWYFEIYQKSGPGGVQGAMIGIRGTQAGINGAGDNPGRVADGYCFYGYNAAQNIVSNGAYVTYGSVVAYGPGDIISVAVDLDNNKCWWAKNGTYINSGNPSSNSDGLSITAVASTTLGEYFPCFGDYDAQSYVLVANFGQDGTFAGNKAAQGNLDSEGIGNFYYAVPTGFKALCSKNLPDCAVTPSENFSAITWSGNNAQTISTVGFEPDFVWFKCRSAGNSHELLDTLRGATNRLRSEDTTAEYSESGGLTSFTSTGYVLGSNNGYNASGETYVSWNWKAGTDQGSTATSGSGTAKTYTASYNVDAGFSIVAYTGNGTAGHTIPHHLGVKPDLMMVKQRNGTGSWTVYADVNLMGAEKFMELHNNAAVQDSLVWSDVEPTTSVFAVGNHSDTNTNDATYLAYCWREIEGYSKIGSYEGNGNADGSFIYTGFKPKFVITKPMEAASNWHMYDTGRSTSNPVDKKLSANLPSAEAGPEIDIDILSNGFKTRRVTSALSNSGEGYLYMAFAETPFKYTTAR
jgi:hypothetical protein